MNRTQALIWLNQQAQAFGPLAPEHRPSAYLTSLGATDWDAFWSAWVEEARREIQAYVWNGEILPTGRPAPEEAVPGASYIILVPNGTVVFQYGDSPFAPETPGMAPGTLTEENVEAAMEAHATALAEQLALEKLARGYLDWLAERLL